MASLRRSKALTPDSQTARFLYTILKQLDLKSIDWNEVAENLDITNGHAARMRYSRFKQQIEGIPSTPRGSRAKKDGDKTGKSRGKGKRERENEFEYDSSSRTGLVKPDGRHDEKRFKGDFNIEPHFVDYGCGINPFWSMGMTSELMDIRYAEPTTTLQNPPWFQGQTNPIAPMQIMAASGSIPIRPLPPPLPTVSMSDIYLSSNPINSLPPIQYDSSTDAVQVCPAPEPFPPFQSSSVPSVSVLDHQLSELGSTASTCVKNEGHSEDLNATVEGFECEPVPQETEVAESDAIVIKPELIETTQQEPEIKIEASEKILID